MLRCQVVRQRPLALLLLLVALLHAPLRAPLRHGSPCTHDRWLRTREGTDASARTARPRWFGSQGPDHIVQWMRRIKKAVYTRDISNSCLSNSIPLWVLCTRHACAARSNDATPTSPLALADDLVDATPHGITGCIVRLSSRVLRPHTHAWLCRFTVAALCTHTPSGSSSSRSLSISGCPASLCRSHALLAATFQKGSVIRKECE